MLPATVDLDPDGVDYEAEAQNSFAAGSVKHAFAVDLDIK